MRELDLQTGHFSLEDVLTTHWRIPFSDMWANSSTSTSTATFL